MADKLVVIMGPCYVGDCPHTMLLLFPNRTREPLPAPSAFVTPVLLMCNALQLFHRYALLGYSLINRSPCVNPGVLASSPQDLHPPQQVRFEGYP
ncbi:hypothetical protein FKM82_019998 [Ascaphus truei]